ncbi:MAG: hypothetical protein AAF298_00390 [Cyanobacteria bacterium P01_A01_bin.40]
MNIGLVAHEKYINFLSRNFKSKLNPFDPPQLRFFYPYLIGIIGGFTFAAFEKTITAKKIIPNVNLIQSQEISGHLEFLFGFLEGCSNREFDAYLQFQKDCDRFLENYLVK